MKQIMPLVPAKHRSTVAESFADLLNYNLLQPPNAGAAAVGAKERLRQWQSLSGRVTPPNIVPLAGGACAGVGAGVLLALALVKGGVPATLGPPFAILLAIVCAPLGSILAMRFWGAASFYGGMMLVVLNERRSRIYPAKVTAQVEAYVPKSLLAWRSHDWRYHRGQPYLWTHYEVGKRLPNRPLTTADYLLNENDGYRARDVAVYARRNTNRMISRNAEDFLDADAQNTEEESRWAEIMPWLTPPLLLGVGLVMFVMSAG